MQVSNYKDLLLRKRSGDLTDFKYHVSVGVQCVLKPDKSEIDWEITV